jgi:hypothetical protein
MNLKDLMKNLTDEEICVMLKDLKDLQEERQKEKDEPDHYYEFTGTWSWGVWAKSKDEAVECFKESCIEEFEILTDEYEVQQYE